MDDREKLSLKANLSHCIGLLEIDGTNTKSKVKKELKRILEVYFQEEKEKQFLESNGIVKIFFDPFVLSEKSFEMALKYNISICEEK